MRIFGTIVEPAPAFVEPGIADDVLVTHRLSVDVNTGGSKFWEMERGFTRDGANYDSSVQNSVKASSTRKLEAG